MSLNHKAVKKTLILNKNKIKVLTSLVVLSVISGANLIKMHQDNERKEERNNQYEILKEKNILNNDVFFTIAQNGSNILLANFETNVQKEFTLSNDNIIDSNGKIINLNGETKDTYFFQYKLSEKILDNIGLKESNITLLAINGSGVGNYVVNYLPSTLTSLSFRKCSFITNLDELPNKCPNIECLDLNQMPSLSNLDFIYRLPKLKEVYLAESPYLTTDLLNYLYKKNIRTNVGAIDVCASLYLDTILDEIITPNMSDSEKIKQITLYVINGLYYDLDNATKSNSNPLTDTLLSRRGVCTSYAYLTTALLNKANIKSFKVINDDHAWVLVNLDNKYYYLDPTNIKTNDLYQNILKILNLSKNYMIDTESTFNTCMTKPNDEKTIISLELINDIAIGRDKKSLIEKYGSTIINDTFYIASILASIFTYLGIIPIIGSVILTYDLNQCMKADYEDEITRQFIKNLE